MATLIGHNGGPTMEDGTSWRSHCWRAARARLLPVLPVEVVRLRVKRAAELGLDYKTYAGVRATTGRDLVAFLFSSNALGLSARDPQPDQAMAAKLARLAHCGKIALVHLPLRPEMVATMLPFLDDVHAAPALLAPDRDIRARLRQALGGHAADAVLLVGDNGLEREWCAQARLAGYLPASRYFAALP